MQTVRTTKFTQFGRRFDDFLRKVSSATFVRGRHCGCHQFTQVCNYSECERDSYQGESDTEDSSPVGLWCHVSVTCNKVHLWLCLYWLTHKSNRMLQLESSYNRIKLYTWRQILNNIKLTMIACNNMILQIYIKYCPVQSQVRQPAIWTFETMLIHIIESFPKRINSTWLLCVYISPTHRFFGNVLVLILGIGWAGRKSRKKSSRRKLVSQELSVLLRWNM